MSIDASALFQAFVEGLSSEQEPDIEALCREHPEHEQELRERFAEWQAILKDIRLGGVSLDSPASDDSSALIDEVVHRLRKRLGEESRYEILGEFARGGMGVVLRVWDRDLRRTLAMKVVLGREGDAGQETTPQLDERSMGRFLEEAQVTGQLDHPGIVPVHELGLDGSGRVFFTMKLVKGEDLRSVFERVTDPNDEDWNETRALNTLLRVCEAMAYAHSKQVLHRDLKPANVMVGKYGEVYVMDWGLARVQGQEDRHDLRMAAPVGLTASKIRSDRRETSSDALDSPLVTMDGDVVGTPSYMPPEQADGRLEELGPHSDVYAVGAMLYHLLTGRMPFIKPGDRVSPHTLLAMVRHAGPQPIHEIRKDCPPELLAICDRAMAREIGDRYPDMTALASDLRAFLENRVVEAYESGAVAELKKWVRRNPALTTTAAAALVAVLALAGWALVERHSALASEQIALAERDRADRKAEEAESEKQRVLRLSDIKSLNDLKAQADDLWPAHPDRVEPMKAWLQTAETVLGNLAEHERVLADLRTRGAPMPHPEAEALAALRRQEETLTDQGARPAGNQQSLRRRIELLSARIARERPHEFPDRQDAWWHDTLVDLVTGLVAISSESRHGATVASVRDRLAFAESVERKSFTDHREEWDEAIASIADPEECPQYGGLELQDQLGLVPIGRDADSGLWEFWHMKTGDRPRRDDDGKLVLSESTGLVFVLVPGGTFFMGCQKIDPDGRNYDPYASRVNSHEGRPVEVTLDPFFLSKYEMTQGQWTQLTGDNPSDFGPDNWQSRWLSSGSPASLLHPVEQVSWAECFKWLERARVTLPSEAQWEYAARAGTDTIFWSGDTVASLENKANVFDAYANSHGGESYGDRNGFAEFDDGSTRHAPVGNYEANPFGLHDIHGNVLEWCLDGYDANFYGIISGKNPVSPWPDGGARTCRGGNYRGVPGAASIAVRVFFPPLYFGHALGVRPARLIAE